MNAQELEKLLSEVTPGKLTAPQRFYIWASYDGLEIESDDEGNWVSYEDHEKYINDSLDKIARRVIAAEKLVKALRYYSEGTGDLGEYGRKALSEWESAQ